MESVVLLLGLCIVSAGGYDFFYTTLSGSGAAFITRTMLILSHFS